MKYKAYQYRYNNEWQDGGNDLILEDEYGAKYQCVPIDKGMMDEAVFLGTVNIPTDKD